MIASPRARFVIPHLHPHTPDAFAFTAQTGVEIGEARLSNAVTLTGINTTVPISIQGGEYAVVTTNESFKSEFRSGRHNAYWISGGAKKMQGTLAEEIREAAFRGETLVIDGVHDQRNKDLDEVAGVPRPTVR